MNLKILIIIASLIFCFGCGDIPESNKLVRKNIFAESNFFGERRLVKLRTRDQNNMNISGSFFLGSGSITTDNLPTINVSFQWEAEPGTYYMSVLPANKIIWKAVEGQENPTIEFTFRDEYLNYRKDSSEPGAGNLNYYLSMFWLEYATVRASKELLEKEDVYITIKK